MKLLLVNFFPPETMARYLLSSYLLKSYLNRHISDPRLDVEVADFSCLDTARRVVPELLKRGPELIGFSCYAWNMDLVRECLEVLKRHNGPACVLGGPEISPEVARDLCGRGLGDHFCIGDGEEWLLALMRGFLDSTRDARGRRSSRGEENDFSRQPPADLGQVPPVYLSGSLDQRLYRYQQAFLETQRGCRNRCAYCLYHKHAPRIAYFPLEQVIAEIDHLLLEQHVQALRIFDPVFTSDLDRAKRIVRHLLELKKMPGVSLPWMYWEFTMDSVDLEFLELTSRLKSRNPIHNADEVLPADRPQLYSAMLKDYTVVNCVGLQSLHAGAQRASGRKPANLAGVRSFFQQAAFLNLAVKLDIMLGLPGETFESYFAGLADLLPLFKGTDHILNIHRVQLLPGTELARRAEVLGMIHAPDLDHVVLATPGLPARTLEHAARLTALLFRIINSPLRSRFFEALGGRGLAEMLEGLLEGAVASSQCRFPPEDGKRPVDDVYWNDAIFTDIPSAWVDDALKARRRVP